MTLKGKDYFMRRCHELALLGKSYTSPNPKVGALIVENDEIIGEGWHERYGGDHAEIKALSSVPRHFQERISKSSIYVSLEPCSIYGNTPPCTDAILREGIQKVVVSARDRTQGVNGVSEYILRQKNLSLQYGVENELGEHISRPRNVFVTNKRPYIILKWAESKDGYIGRSGERTAISNAFTRRYVHRMRSEVDAILVGSNTVKIDNPSLTTRYHTGEHPLRVVLGHLSATEKSAFKIFTDGLPTLLIQPSDHSSSSSIQKYCCDNLYDRKVMTLLVEGGRQTLEGFLEQGIWDECHIITNDKNLKAGVSAPQKPSTTPTQCFSILSDHIEIFHNI